jgi:hypothetical protein
MNFDFFLKKNPKSLITVKTLEKFQKSEKMGLAKVILWAGE